MQIGALGHHWWLVAVASMAGVAALVSAWRFSFRWLAAALACGGVVALWLALHLASDHAAEAVEADFLLLIVAVAGVVGGVVGLLLRR